MFTLMSAAFLLAAAKSQTISQTLDVCRGYSFTLPLNASVSVDTNPSSTTYLNGMACCFAILSSSGSSLALRFTSFTTEGGYDYFSVYDGSTANSPLLGSYSGSLPSTLTLQSSGSALYLCFSSDSSVVSTGVAVLVSDAAIGSSSRTSSPTATPTRSTTLRVSQSPLPERAGNVNLCGQVGTTTFSSTRALQAGSILTTDTNPGWPTYLSSSSCALTLTMTGRALRVSFSLFQMEENYDFFSVFDGSSTAAPLLGRFSGSTLPTDLITSGGALTLLFTSDNMFQLSGVIAVVSDAGSVTPTPTSTPTSSSTMLLPSPPAFLNLCGSTTAYSLAPGGSIAISTNPSSASYLAYMSCTLTLAAASSSARLRVTFTAFATEACCDTYSVYDGSNTAAGSLFSGSGTTLPGSLISTGSTLTLRFTSDLSVQYSGVIVTVAEAGLLTVGLSASGTSTSSPTGTRTASGTPSPSSGVVVDICGPSSYTLSPGGNVRFSTNPYSPYYSADRQCSVTIRLLSPGSALRCDFLAFSTDSAANFRVHDVVSGSEVLLGSFSGSSIPSTWDGSRRVLYSSSYLLILSFSSGSNNYNSPYTGVVVRISDASVGSPTPTSTATPSPTPTGTPTGKPSLTGTPSGISPTPTKSRGYTFSSSTTPSGTDTPSNTPASSTATPTPTLTPTLTPTTSLVSPPSPDPVCPAGTYLSLANLAPLCEPCPQGTYSAALGATSPATCLSCAAGTASASLGATSPTTCLPCGLGYTATTPRTAACSQCPAGFFPATPASPCAPCPAGQAGGGGSACALCTPGSWSPAGSGACALCPPGRASNSPGASALDQCSPCAPGSAAGMPGAPCTACPLNFYASGSAALACAPCPPGTGAPTPGSSTCSAVGAGSVAPAFGARQVCPAGTYVTSSALACTPCPPGRSSGSAGGVGLGACQPCGAGTASGVAGAAACAACPAGRWASGGALACTECSYSTTSSAGASTCAACSTAATFPGMPDSACPAQCPAGYTCGSGSGSSASPAAQPPTFFLPSVSPSGGTAAAAAAPPCAFALPAGGALQAFSTNLPGTTYAASATLGCKLAAPSGYSLTLSFTAFQTEAFGDVLEVFRGSTATLPALQSFSGQSAIPSATFSTGFGGSLYVRFTSDFNNQYNGVTALLEITQCPAGAVCPDGSVALTGTPCPAGRYAPSPSSFPPGSYPATCQSCAPGRYAGAPGAWQCDFCLPGYFASAAGASVCSACPPGTQQDASGSTSCAPCGAGFFSPAASLTCTPCPLGTSSSAVTAADSSSCAACSPGSYGPAVGKGVCESCPPTTFSLASGAISSQECSPCPDGSTSTPGSSSCVLCSAGKWGAGGACTPCPAGTASTATGAASSASCMPCAPGSAAREPGSFSCTLCQAGTSAPAPGSALCLPAPPGTAIALPGSSTAVAAPCSPGSFASTPFSSACTPCSAGRFSAAAGALYCDVCSVGSTGGTGLVGLSSASAACTPCGVGRYGQWPGAPTPALCLQCGPGTYSGVLGARGASACSPCPAGRASRALGAVDVIVCAACALGSWAVPGSEACRQCPGGSYGTIVSAGSQADGCRPCPPGQVSIVPGATALSACSECLPGKASGLFPDNTACFPCNPGSFSVAPASVNCTLCPAGRAALHPGAATADACIVCPVGTYAEQGGGQCRQCPPNTFQPLLGAGSAAQCLTCKFPSRPAASFVPGFVTAPFTPLHQAHTPPSPPSPFFFLTQVHLARLPTWAQRAAKPARRAQ